MWPDTVFGNGRMMTLCAKRGGTWTRTLVAAVLSGFLPNAAFAHGQEFVLPWFWSQVALLLVTALSLVFLRARMKTKFVLLAAVVALAGAINGILFFWGSVSFLSQLGPLCIFIVFGLLPPLVVGAVYRFRHSRRS